MRAPIVIAFVALAGCKEDPTPPVRPVAEPAARSPAVAPPQPAPEPAPEPAEPAAPAGELEAAATDLAGGALAASPARLAFGPEGEHLVALTWSDDGTDVEVVAGLAGGTRVSLGSIQQEHEDQVRQILSVAPCPHDGDPAAELCVSYRADPLGSLREEPYVARTVFDWDEAAQRFTSSSAPASEAAPAPPR